MKILVSISLVLAASNAARADQCQSVSDEVARRAARALIAHRMIVELCEPCGDRAPGSPVRLESVELRDREVLVDGRPIDLAYTYIQTSERTYENLAALAGCAAQGVSPRLRVESATEHGVLIVADSQPPAPPAAGPPPTLLIVTEASSPLWIAVAVGAGGAVLMWLLVAGVLGRRKRRAMRPRAVELVARE